MSISYIATLSQDNYYREIYFYVELTDLYFIAIIIMLSSYKVMSLEFS